MLLSELQKKITKILAEGGIETNSLDARIILREIFNFDEKELILNSDLILSESKISKVQKIITRRLNFEPVSKIFGKRDFYNSTFSISDDVLDPRPETEHIVEIANNFILEKGYESFIDLGTGSGCIILSILKENKNLTAVGVDISIDAINIAKKNSKDMKLEKRSSFLVSNWLSSIYRSYDLIISNPPYIPSDEIITLSKTVKNFDPLISLDGGQDGLKCYKEIAQDINRVINKNGRVILEIGYNQAHDVIKIFESKEFNLLKIYNDINGLNRILTFDSKKT
ncbi:peptide chain release factor N(5)-glutamine methyltransferase [Hyphomicrobiales bacterium]|nr:peptide chain release factor N(5)-glutamine methyltransferase [Hyphomicrobiales bacterium]